MGKGKRNLGVDRDGVRKVMRKRDYLADMGGQLGLGIMGNIIGQLTYFYTDKVGIAVGAVGVMMAIAKVIDALTDIWFGNVIEHSKGGNKKYYQWMFRMAVPAAVTTILLFTVPIQAGQIVGLAYVLITNILMTAVVYTMIATPFAAAMIVRTESQSERESMGVFRAVGNYGAGMVIAIMTIPVTNILGGTQTAWIKYGTVLAFATLLFLLICYNNGRKALLLGDAAADIESAGQTEEEEEKVSFKEAVRMLFQNRYWVIVLLFNLITSVTNGISASAGTYYSKWIFGNDNLVAVTGSFGLLATILGFIFSKPIIAKLGVKKTVNFGLLGGAAMAAVKCIFPTNFTVNVSAGLIASFMQIPLMCLYGVLLAMAVDYNEYKYDKKLVAVSSGAIGFGNKVGGGIGSVLLTGFLAIGAYDATLEAATTSMRYSIYAFSNYLPLLLNIGMFLIFRKFDIEEKLPQMRAEIAKRREAKGGKD